MCNVQKELASYPPLSLGAMGQTLVFVGSIFSILILTSNLDTVYPGSPKNTFRLKKFQDLVPQIAP